MDELEKQQRLHQTLELKFEPFLPCSTQNCLNEVHQGTTSYDRRANGWVLAPLCRECVIKQMKKYGVQPE